MCAIGSLVKSGYSVYPTRITTDVTDSVMPEAKTELSSEAWRRVQDGLVGRCTMFS